MSRQLITGRATANAAGSIGPIEETSLRREAWGQSLAGATVTELAAVLRRDKGDVSRMVSRWGVQTDKADGVIQVDVSTLVLHLVQREQTNPPPKPKPEPKGAAGGDKPGPVYVCYRCRAWYAARPTDLCRCGNPIAGPFSPA